MNDVPDMRGERWSGIVLHRGGVFAAGVVAAVAVLAALLVPVHGWRPWIALPLVLLAAVPLARWTARLPAPPVPVWAASLLVAIATGHGVWAALTRSEQVVLRRDAGSYALYAQWVATRHGLPIPAGLDAFGGAEALADRSFTLASPAFFQVLHGLRGAPGATAEIVPQFLVGAPAWFSAGWWVAGWDGLLIAPAVASALALLAVGGLAARLVGPRMAVLAVGALAICGPEVHAARSTYSEPLALLLVAAACCLLVDAVAAGNDTGPDGDPRPVRRLALAAGLAFGLAGLVRVDALREVVLLLPVAAVLALRRHPSAGPLAVGALAGSALSFAWAGLFSRPYLAQVAGSLLPLAAGGAVLGLGSAVAVVWARRRAGTRADLGPRPPTGRTVALPRAAAVAVLLTGVLLATRPLWQTVRQDPADPGSKVVASLQVQQHLPVDGGRTYAEHSLEWVSWWLGPVAVVAAWVTFAALAAAAVGWWLRTGGGGSRPDVPVWLGPAVVGLASTVLTLYRPGITPDHPWADRRLAVEVLPAVVLAAVGAVSAVTRLARRRWPAWLLVTVPATCAGALLAPTALATLPVATARTEVREPVAVAQLCRVLRPGDAVLSVDVRASNEWTQVIRGACDRPAASITFDPLSGQLPAVIRAATRITAAGGRAVLIAGSASGAELESRALAAAGVAGTPRKVVHVGTWEDPRLLTERPAGVVHLDVDVWLAVLPPEAAR